VTPALNHVCWCGRYTIRDGVRVVAGDREHTLLMCDEEGGDAAFTSDKPKPCDTPNHCHYDPVLKICDYCGADVEIRYLKA